MTWIKTEAFFRDEDVPDVVFDTYDEEQKKSSVHKTAVKLVEWETPEAKEILEEFLKQQKS